MTPLRARQQTIYHCGVCRHEGVAYLRIGNRYRWYFHVVGLAPLFLPWLGFLALVPVFSMTNPTRECASCHSRNIKRIGYVTEPGSLDPDVRYNARHQRITFGIALVSFVVWVLIELF